MQATWYMRQGACTANASAAVLAGGIAGKSLIFQNQSTTNVMSLTFDGSIAAANRGTQLLAGDYLRFAWFEIPTGPISVYCDSGDPYLVAWA